MKSINAVLVLAGLSVFNSSYSHAADAPPVGWKSTAEAGVVVTNGNSKTSTVNAKFDTNRESDNWRHNIHAEALSSNSSGVNSAEKYLASGKSDYKFNEFDYLFGLVAFEKDLFSGFENQLTIAAGYGRRVLHTDTMTLDLEAGPGIRFYKIDENVNPDAGREREAILRLAAKYLWKLSPNAKFTEDLTAEIGQDTTISKSITGLQANINSSLAMKATVTIKHTSTVPVGTRETDTETALTLVYAF